MRKFLGEESKKAKRTDLRNPSGGMASGLERLFYSPSITLRETEGEWFPCWTKKDDGPGVKEKENPSRKSK